MRRDVGRELRLARVLAGLTQREVADRLGRARSHVSRVEHGRMPTLNLTHLATHAALVGLKPWLRLYPAIGRPLDAGQLALFERLRSRLAASWSVRLEVPMPGSADLRAADVTLSIPGCICVVELITRVADFQAQVQCGEAQAARPRSTALDLGSVGKRYQSASAAVHGRRSVRGVSRREQGHAASAGGGRRSASGRTGDRLTWAMTRPGYRGGMSSRLAGLSAGPAVQPPSILSPAR